jgi:hypothetical protein
LTDHVTGALDTSHGQDGHREPCVLALLVLGDSRGDGAVILEAAAQRLGVGCEQVDVVLDGLRGKLVRPGRSVELGTEEDLLATVDEELVDLRKLD